MGRGACCPSDGLGGIHPPRWTGLFIAPTWSVPGLSCKQDVLILSSSPVLLHLNFRLKVRCIFNASDFLPLQASIFPPPSSAPVTQSGPLRFELLIAKGTMSPRPILFLPPLPRCTAHEPLSLQMRLSAPTTGRRTTRS